MVIKPDVVFTETSLVTVSIIYNNDIKTTIPYPYKEIKVNI